MFFRAGNELLQVTTELVLFTDDPQADSALPQLFDLPFKITGKQRHQTADFCSWPLPVFAAEGEQGQHLNIVALAGVKDTANLLNAGAVASDSAQAALTSPAIVAIHDHRQMV